MNRKNVEVQRAYIQSALLHFGHNEVGDVRRNNVARTIRVGWVRSSGPLLEFEWRMLEEFSRIAQGKLNNGALRNALTTYSRPT
jgi:hypothetical protein